MAGNIITSPELIRSHGNPDLVKTTFSPAVQAGPFVFVSGTGAQDTSQDCRGQTEQVFQYISQVLAEAGYALRDVIRVQAFITKVGDYTAYNEVRRKYFPKDPPASATLVADFVRQGLLVEVEAVAYKE